MTNQSQNQTISHISESLCRPKRMFTVMQTGCKTLKKSNPLYCAFCTLNYVFT